MRQIRFDDLPALKEMVSEEYGSWGAQLQITQEMINEFADLTGDHQWIHVDVERAKKGPFGAPIAQGLLTVALMPRIRSPSSFQVVGQGNTVNYGSDGYRFLTPVRVGDTVQARSRLLEVQQHSRGTRLTLEIAVHVVGVDRPALLFKAVVLHAPPA